MSIETVAGIRNSEAVDISSIPILTVESFQGQILTAVEAGQRIASMFGHRIESDRVRVFAVLTDDVQHAISILSTELSGPYPSLTPRCPQAHLFEREILEQFGVEPEGHPWLKPVRVHYFPGNASSSEENGRLRYRYFKMKGEEIHEVAVGPVHAGVIEPGHFRFQCQGEIVHHLEIHLGYQHRGVEEALLGGPHKRTMAHMETIAGDTSVGHATAYCQAKEALAGSEVSPRAQAIRAIALELERLANHVGDMGALANDVGFLPTAAFCGRLRGEYLNMTAAICGSRFGRGLVRPGGAAFDIDGGIIDEIAARLRQAEKDTNEALSLFFNSHSVVNRLEGTGRVTTKDCLDMGIVGVAARASGLARDVRADHPSGLYETAAVPMALLQSGDVFARAAIRRMEIEHSIRFVEQQIQSLPGGALRMEMTKLRANQICVALVEGWRGEIAHVAITDEHGRFTRYKIVDPSFHNWSALALALRGQQISDFPLCNKSFNLSYCGFDL